MYLFLLDNVGQGGFEGERKAIVKTVVFWHQLYRTGSVRWRGQTVSLGGERPGTDMTVRMPGMLGVWGSPGHCVWGTAGVQAGQDGGGRGVGCLDMTHLSMLCSV